MNIRTKKNIGMLVLTIAVIFAIVQGGTSLAYFYTQKDHDSYYQLARIQTRIDEEFKQESENIYKKNPSIKNIGENDCIVRVKIAISPSNAKDNLTLKGLDNVRWIYNESGGYYYYQDILAPNKTTESVFNQVVVTNIDKMTDFDIIIYNEAIQINAYNDEGQKLSALDESGRYNQQKALELWKYYK